MDEHRHAPKPVQVSTRLADGLLQIVETPDGERMQLRVYRHVEGLSARVDIARDSGTEILAPRPVDGDHHWLRSSAAPPEPHAFEELPFAMAEPERHEH